MATLIVPAPLRRFTNNSARINVNGDNVDEALRSFIYLFPDVKKHLLDTENNVRPFINIFVNEQHIRSMQQQYTPVNENAIISIIPAIAGG